MLGGSGTPIGEPDEVPSFILAQPLLCGCGESITTWRELPFCNSAFQGSIFHLLAHYADGHTARAEPAKAQELGASSISPTGMVWIHVPDSTYRTLPLPQQGAGWED